MEHARTSTEVTCTSCGKPASVPFVPTPGRPVFCRECFSKRSPPPGGPARSSSPARSAPRFGRSSGPRPHVEGARKRMLAQGRKGHFMYDALAVLRRTDEGAMDEQHHRAFLEGLFARGSRDSASAAQDFLDEKLEEKTITADEHRGLSDLLQRYSFWR